MNVQSVLVIDGVDIWHPKVVQASAGALAYVTIKHCSWQELSAHKGDRKLYALTVSGGVSPEAVNADQVLLVVGNEAHGIPDHAVALCDGSITIPMPGNTESLNAAVAGSIALYQVFGQLRKS
jgi:TrmH family RNA methyltransferase